ncbi:unnamed protein product [Closterium sp. NIES-64]|nr:unnamed protein product [Closterium sp. NIES-64]
MATPSVLAFDAEGRAIDFDVWVDDLQLFLQCDRADGLSLFDLTSGASPAPAADADATVRSQWATRDAAARLAVRRHLPTSERAHFSQYKSAQTLYDAVVARYSSPATAALSRLMLPYLFPDLAAFPTVTDLITHLRTSDTRYRAALPAEFCAKNPPPMYITFYYIVTRLLVSLRVVRDHFLSVCPTTLTVDLLEKALLVAEKSIVAIGASRGDPHTPIFEGRSVRRLPLAGDAALAKARGAGALEELAGAVEAAVEAAEGVGVAVGVVAGVEVSVAAVEAEAAAVVAMGAEVAEVAAVEEAVAEEVELVGVALRRGSAPVVVSASSSSSALVTSPPPQQLREWYAARQRGGGTGPCTYVLRTGDRAGEQCGGAHSTQRCFGRLTDAWRHQFPEAAEIPRWGELSRAGVAVFDLDFDAILAAMYAVTINDEGDCYRCFPPDPGIETAALGTGEAAALGASEAAALGARASAPSGAGEFALSGTASASASHTFTLDSGASRSFFRDRTILTPLGRPVAVSLADPYGECLLQRPGMASRVLVSGLPRSLPPLPPGPGPTCIPCVEGRQRAAPHSSQFPPTEAPLQTLHMDVWGPARVRGQGHERYFLLVVDDYSRYTTVFPLRSKGDVTEVLIDWIRAARLQLRQSFGSDFPVLCLHSDRGGEFSSGLLRAYCRARGIRHTFTLPDSPQISRPETSPALLWTGKVGDASTFRVWGSRAFVRDLSADKLSPRAAPCVFLGFPPDAPGWQFYHPTSRRVLSSQDVTFDESVPYYRLFPYRTPSPPPATALPCARLLVTLVLLRVLSLGVLTLGVLSVWVLRLGVLSLRVLLLGVQKLGGAEPRGATTGGAEPGGTEPGGATPWGAEPWGATPGGAEPGVRGVRELGLLVWRLAVLGLEVLRVLHLGGSHSLHRSCAIGLPGARGVLLELEVLRLLRVLVPWVPEVLVLGVLELSGVWMRLELELLRVLALRLLLSVLEAVLLGVLLVLLEVLELEVLLALVLPLGVLVLSLLCFGVAVRPRPYFVPLLQQVLGLPPSTGPPPPLECPQPVSSQLQLQPASPLPAPSPYTGPTGGLAERREPASRPTSPVRPARTSGRGSLAELVDFAARCRLDYAASLVAESDSVCPPSVGGECALGTDVLEDMQEEFQCLGAASPHLVSVLLTPEGDPDALDIPTPRSYAEAIEGPYSSQWVKRPPGSPPVFKARYVARGFSQRQGVDYFQTFSPTPKMTTLRVLLHIAAHRDYELHSLNFSTAFLQGSLHEEIWLRRPPASLGLFLLAPSGASGGQSTVSARHRVSGTTH